jgi:hypothetical protein
LPETTIEILVSFREGDRARLLQAVALDASGGRLPDLPVTIEADADGTFHIEQEHHERQIVTGSNGAAYFSWWQWPRFGPARNLTCIVRATWSSESAIVYLEDLRE